MFFKLFAKECGQMLKSLIYYLFLAALIFFYVSQVGSFTPYSEPLKGQEQSYGLKASSDKQEIMGATLAMLARGYEGNSYTAYPVGFYKNVVLTEEKQEEIHQILTACTGLEDGYTEAIRESDGKTPIENGAVIQMTGVNPPILAPAEDLSYDKFLRYMKKADKIIGGGTSYAVDKIKNNAMTYATYEDAKKIYDASLYTDRISRGKARIFCDYIGIILGLLPVFLAVTRTLRDKRSMAREVIYARKASSVTIIAARYFCRCIPDHSSTVIAVSYAHASVYVLRAPVGRVSGSAGLWKVHSGMDFTGGGVCSGVGILPVRIRGRAGCYFSTGGDLDRKHQRRRNKAGWLGGLEPDPPV